MSYRLFFWLAGIAGFISLTRILPIKFLKPIFLQNPQFKTFLFWVAVAIVMAVIGVLIKNSEPPKLVTRR